MGCPLLSTTSPISFVLSFCTHSTKMLSDRHPYGIKAYHVSYGIGNSFLVNARSNGKVFKFVIDKVDPVLTGIRFYNLEGLRHGDVSEIMCDSLCTD
jgi:hypothetical protein